MTLTYSAQTYIHQKHFGFNCNKSASDNSTAKYEMLYTLKYKLDNRGKPHTHKSKLY